MNPYVDCIIIYLGQDMERTWVSIVDEWIKKRWYKNAVEYYLAIEKNKLLPSATTWMDLEGIVLSGISQTEKGKCHKISLSCGI